LPSSPLKERRRETAELFSAKKGPSPPQEGSCEIRRGRAGLSYLSLRKGKKSGILALLAHGESGRETAWSMRDRREGVVHSERCHSPMKKSRCLAQERGQKRKKGSSAVPSKRKSDPALSSPKGKGKNVHSPSEHT